MLTKQIFRTLAGADKRAKFENAHSKFKWTIVRCFENGEPVNDMFSRSITYVYRLKRTAK